LPAVTGQGGGERGVQRGEQAGPLGGGQFAEPPGEVFGQPAGDAVAAAGRAGGPRMVGGQVEGQVVGEVGAPVVQLAGGDTAGQPVAVPDGEVGVLQRGGGQRVRAVPVEGAQFGGDDAGGPAVGHDVVQGQEQHVVVVGEAVEDRAQQRARREVEGGGGAGGAGVAAGLLGG